VDRRGILIPSPEKQRATYEQTRTGYAEIQDVARKGSSKGRRKQVTQVSSSYLLPQVVIRVELLI
jgi:hypothetical protein